MKHSEPAANKAETRSGRFLSAYWAPLILSILVFSLLGFSLKMPWSLVDDPITCIYIPQILDKAVADLSLTDFKGAFYEGKGAFRPFYWIFHWARYQVAGTNAAICHLLHILWGLATVLLVYAVGGRLSSRAGGFLSALLFLWYAPTLRNWYDLCTGEGLIILFQALCLYSLVRVFNDKGTKRHKWWLTLCLLCILISYFSKETTVALLPWGILALITFWNHSRNRLYAGIFIAGNIISYGLLKLCAIWVGAPETSKAIYTSHYHTDLATIIPTAFQTVRFYASHLITLYFLPLLLCLGTLYFLWKYHHLSSRKLKWLFLLFSWFILQVGIFLPWDIPGTRYLLPAILGLSLCMGMLITQGWELLTSIKEAPTTEPHKKLLGILVVLTLLRAAIIIAALPAWVQLFSGTMWLLSAAVEGLYLYISFKNNDRLDYAGKWLLKLLFIVSLTVFLLENTLLSWHEAHAMVGRETINRALVIWLGKSLKPNTFIALNFNSKDDGGEIISEMGYQLNLLENRADLKLEYLDLDKPDPDYILFWNQYQTYETQEIFARFGEGIQQVKTFKYIWPRFYTHSTGIIKWWISGGRLFYRKGSVYREWKVFKVSNGES